MKRIINFTAILILAAMSIFAQETSSVSYQAVAWSPDGKYLSFTRMEVSNTQPRTMKTDIYIMKADGTEIRRITGDESNEFTSSWSKDGKTIFFGASLQGSRESDIFSVKADGSGLKRLTNGSGRIGSPAVSPDGKKIVYNVYLVERKPQIFVMNADGTEAKNLTNDNTLAFYSPVWSPDGKKIVYYVEKGDNMDQIWVMNTDGSKKTLLTNNIGHNFFPSWSINGKQIIFTSKRDGDEERLYSMNSDGSDIKRMNDISTSNARYSPDGKKIAYISGKFPQTSIMVANADGTNAKKVSP